MADPREIKVPDLGDVGEVDVIEVLVSSGDRISAEDPLVTLESDKATMDVPSPDAGVVREVKVRAGDKVSEGAVILLLEAEDQEETAAEASDGDGGAGETSEEEPEEKATEAGTASASDASAASAPEEPGGDSAPSTPTEASSAPAAEASTSPAPVDEYAFQKAYASPAVRRFARELGVDLGRVRGTGRKDRILKEDVQGHVKKVMAEPAAAGAGGALALPPLPSIDFSKFGEVERKPLTRIQKIAGPNLHRSWLHVPHVTQHDEADVTELEAFRQKHKAEAKEGGFSLTPLVFVMQAVVKALERFPAVNSSLDAEAGELILKRYYHLGIAVDTDDGLMVPVVRDVDQKGLFDLAKELADLSSRTREGKLQPAEMRGASFTISSLGSIGGTFFTPIVNTPEVAILGVSRSRMAPVWRDGAFEPRLMLPLSLSYDHRVIDGALAVRFTTYLAELLGDIRRLLL